MMIVRHEPKQSDFCELAGLMAAYIRDHPDGADRLREFMTDDRGLWDTSDVCQYTGWSRQYISTLCNSNVLPYIPGRPNKFVPTATDVGTTPINSSPIHGKTSTKEYSQPVSSILVRVRVYPRNAYRLIHSPALSPDHGAACHRH